MNKFWRWANQARDSTAEPDFWTCYDLAAANNCEFFTVEEVNEK